MQLMKNITLALVFTLLLAACSSGTTVSDLPQNATSRFTGSFNTTIAGESGTVTIDLVEDAAGALTGNIIFTPNGNSCLRNASVSGTTSGFNIALEAAQSSTLFTTITTIREASTTDSDGNTVTGVLISTSTTTSSSGSVGTTVSTASNGETTTRVTSSSDVNGTLRMQFAISNNGTNLNGTYVVEGQTCSDSTDSGTMNLNG